MGLESPASIEGGDDMFAVFSDEVSCTTQDELSNDSYRHDHHDNTSCYCKLTTAEEIGDWAIAKDWQGREENQLHKGRGRGEANEGEE